MKHHILKRLLTGLLFAICAVSVSAQTYYLNVYEKDGKRTSFPIENVDSVKLSMEAAPIVGLEYVDLGLSVKWATMNLGATSPYEAGDYYAWGETQPKTSYTNATYKYFQFDETAGYYKYTKYGFHSNSGIVDYKYRLDMEDDAARVNWGSEWRMPTAEEMEELFYECEWQWITDTVNLKFIGYKVIGPNGNYIYLPIGQYKNDENGSSGNYSDKYWSSYTSYLTNTLDPDNIGNAKGIDIFYEYYYGEEYSDYMLMGEGRVFGELIRPVYSSETPDNTSPALTHFDVKEKNITLSVGETYHIPFEMDQSVYMKPYVLVYGNGLRNHGDGWIAAMLPGSYSVVVNLADFTVELNVTVNEPEIVAEAVDLGLSVKWATNNLGAETPSQYGYYYAWGETTPRFGFNEWNYKWYDPIGDILTKYVNDADAGTPDNKLILDAEDDAAHVLWGGTWRMPTAAEFDELLSNCRWEWTQVNGVNGYKITSLIDGYTDNSIFLPAAGYDATTTQGEGGYGYYLTSSLIEGNCYFAYGMTYRTDASTLRLKGLYRMEGFPIRPVQGYDAAYLDTVMIDASELQLSRGETYQITAYGFTATGKMITVDGLTWASSDTTVATVRDGVVAAVAEGTAIITASYDNKEIKCTVTVNDPSKPQYVDLGLSVKWATFNIGATSPEEFGNYYAWGETEVKDCYNDSTYKWYDVDTESHLKYNLYPEFGTVDNKYRLDPDDDVAYMTWGEGWRLPTYEECIELVDNCSWTWVMMNNVFGYEIRSYINDNSIFLPAAGYIAGRELYDAGDFATYMTSSLNLYSSNKNFNVLCLEDDGISNYFRYSGYAVRAVYSSTFADNVLEIGGVTLDEQSVALETGQQIKLTATADCDSTLTIKWSSDNPSVARVDTKGTIVGVSAGECIVTASLFGYTASCTVTVTESVQLIESVDLGLSVMWASANVGASRVEDFGGYYAWGETEQKASYDWTNYKWNDSTDPNDLIISKYNYQDGKTVLEPDDDVAHVQWGGEWRMPTRAEYEEFLRKCTFRDSVEINGVLGRTAIAPNGNSIFLPYAGEYLGSSCSYKYGATYATSSLYLYYDETECYIGDYQIWRAPKYVGYSVRPVRAYTSAELTSVSLDNDKVGLVPGESIQLSINEKVTGTLDAEWISTDESVATVQDGLITAINNGTCGVIIIVGEAKDTCVVNVVGPESVDLGLSVNWATFNIGTDTPEGFGKYFAWGETETKSSYSWSNYKYGTQDSCTKYVQELDGKTVLDPEDDAAHVIWGGDWRMPTADEYLELVNNCTWEWTTLNGVMGYLVTSMVDGYEGNSIFLPGAGYSMDSGLGGLGSQGDYWSSSLEYDYYDPQEFYFFKNYHETGSWDKYVGLTIRPVCPNPNYVDKVILSDNVTVLVDETVGGEKVYKVAPRIVADPDNANNQCIVVTAVDDPQGDFDAQLFITISDSVQLLPGDKLELSFRYKANGNRVATTEIHSVPGQWVNYGPDDLFFTRNWQHYSISTTIEDPDQRTFVVNLYYSENCNTYYFDNVEATITTYQVDDEDPYLELKYHRLEMIVGESFYLSHNTNDYDAVYWESLNEKVATVDKQGLITAVATGTCFIVATVGDLSDSCLVIVGNNEYNDTVQAKYDFIVADDSLSAYFYYSKGSFSYEMSAAFEVNDTTGIIECVEFGVVMIFETAKEARETYESMTSKLTSEQIESYEIVLDENIITYTAPETIGKPCEAVITMMRQSYDDIIGEGQSHQVEPIGGYEPTGFENGYAYVDLGLSVNWATYNVGADSLTGYGDYFAWGETEPYYVDGYAQSKVAVWKDSIDNGYWCDKYKYDVYSIVDDKVTYTMTKYCCDSDHGYQGFTDNKVTLEPEDDVAHVQWGGNWRMPSIYEFSELYYNCTWENVIIGGVAGYKITSNVEGYEGRCIFMPMSGFRDMLALEQIGDYGSYWSSTLFESSAVFALGLSFSSEGLDEEYDLSGSLRYCGNSVRPVCPKE